MKKTTWTAFNIIERENDKNVWDRAGVAFRNDDGSFNMLADYWPRNLKFQIRPPKDVVVEFAKKEALAVYDIQNNPDGKSKWVRLGVAWINRDGSMNLSLRATPISGNKLHIRKAPKKKQIDYRELKSVRELRAKLGA